MAAVCWSVAQLIIFEGYMSSAILSGAVWLLLAASPLEPGTHLTYTGTMSGVKDDGNPAVKEFTLTLVALGGEGEATEFAWTLAETGRGGWTWLDHFGKWPVHTAGTAPAEQPTDGLGPALLYSRADGKSVVPIISPVFAADRALEAGANWTVDRFEHRVTGEATKSGRTC